MWLDFQCAPRACAETDLGLLQHPCIQPLTIITKCSILDIAAELKAKETENTSNSSIFIFGNQNQTISSEPLHMVIYTFKCDYNINGFPSTRNFDLCIFMLHCKHLTTSKIKLPVICIFLTAHAYYFFTCVLFLAVTLLIFS